MSVRSSLVSLMQSLFTAGEMARFLAQFGDLDQALPANLSQEEAAFQAVGLLERRGLLGPEFFERLQEKFPPRRAEIRLAGLESGRYAPPPWRSRDATRFEGLPDRRRYVRGSHGQTLSTLTLQATAREDGDAVRWTVKATGHGGSEERTHRALWDALDHALRPVGGRDGLQRWLSDPRARSPEISDLKRVGESLIAFLLGGSETRGAILGALFGSTAVEPNNDAVRLRLDLDSAALLALPWRLIASGDRWLVGDGWTVEYGPNPPRGTRSLPNPFTVLLLAPTGTDRRTERGLGGQHLASTLLQRLGGVWGAAAGQVITPVRDWPAFQDALCLNPSAVLVHAEMDAENERAYRVYLDGPAGETCVSLDDLLGACEKKAVSLLWLGLHARGGGRPSCPPRVATFPGAVWQGAALVPADASAALLSWVEAIARGGVDPVLALHEVEPDAPGLALMQAHRSVESFGVPTVASPNGKDTIRDHLDRKDAKARTIAELGTLVAHLQRRVLTLIAMGGPTDQVPLFHEQLQIHVARQQRPLGAILKWTIVPTPTRFSTTELHTCLEHALTGTAGATLSERLEDQRRVQKGSQAGMPVLWLDWGTVPKGRELSDQHLTDWMAFAHEVLGANCPPDLRIVCFLRKEMEVASPDLCKKLKDAARKVPARERRSGFVHQVALPPIGHVDSDEIADFLSDQEISRCPPEHAPEVALAVIAETGGRFEETVALLERARREDLWATLALKG